MNVSSAFDRRSGETPISAQGSHPPLSSHPHPDPVHPGGLSGQRETRCRGALARALLVLCAVVPATVGAVPVTFDFTGDVVSVIPGTGLFGVVPGDTVTGSYTFDTTLFRFATPFKLDSDSNQAGSAGVFDITINAGGVTRSTSDNARIFGGSLPPLHTVLFQDGGVFTAGIDRFTMQARTSTSGDDSAFLSLSDTLPDPEADGISPGAGNLTPALMLTAPDVSLFTTTDVNFFTARDASGNLEGDIRFRLTSIVAASNGGDPGAAFLPTSGGNGDPSGP